MIWSKKTFEKDAFFDPKIGLFATKWAQMGSIGGYKRANFRFLRVLDPSGVELMQKKLENFWLILAQKDLEKFQAWAQKNRPK